MQQVNRRSFLFGLSIISGATVAASVAMERLPPPAPIAKPESIPEDGVLVIEFDAAQFPHRYDGTGAYHGGVMGALRHIQKGRRFFEVGGQQIFPTYSRDGSPTRMANIILVPENYHDAPFGSANVRWLGGDRFEVIR